jgi:oligoribonuclease
MKNKNNLVWMDLEMTGLNPTKDKIIEIATLITDSELNIIAKGPCLIIHQNDDVLENMNDWCKKHHGESGLTKAVRDSKVSQEEACKQTVDFILQFCEKGRAPLCGNSIGQDRMFLMNHMPQIIDILHYRVVDVSSLKELFTRWYGPKKSTFQKATTHRALDDIIESIEELKFYRERFLIAPEKF